MNNFFIPYASKFFCKVTNKRPQRKKIAPKKPLRAALPLLAGRVCGACRVAVAPLRPQKDAKKGRFLTFLIPIGNKECAKVALLLTKAATPLCARQGDGQQGRWPGLTKGERQNVYLKRFPQPPTHDRKVGARGLWAFCALWRAALGAEAECLVRCGEPLWMACRAALLRGLCETIPFAPRNVWFCPAKGMVSQGKTIRMAKCSRDAANIIKYKKETAVFVIPRSWRTFAHSMNDSTHKIR